MKLKMMIVLTSILLGTLSPSVSAGSTEKNPDVLPEKKKKVSREAKNRTQTPSKKQTSTCESIASVKKKHQTGARKVRGSWKKMNLSYYHPTGKCTASGAVMHSHKLTVAVDSRFPIGSILEIRDPKTGKTFQVFASDRCPNRSCTRKNRIDGTKAVFQQIQGTFDQGIKSIEVRLVSSPS